MKDERREQTKATDVRSANDARNRPGPFTTAVGWLGTAFNRTQISKREADERRRRSM